MPRNIIKETLEMYAFQANLPTMINGEKKERNKLGS
jgi:hypothetical protein